MLDFVALPIASATKTLQLFQQSCECLTGLHTRLQHLKLVLAYMKSFTAGHATMFPMILMKTRLPSHIFACFEILID